MNLRQYLPTDYEQLKALYLDNSTSGGQLDEARDSEVRLRRKIEADPDTIWVVEIDGRLVGTVSLIDDGRVAWLFRFAVLKDQTEAAMALHNRAIEILKSRGHKQVLVYTPVGNTELNSRYEQLEFNKGADYTCFWKEI